MAAASVLFALFERAGADGVAAVVVVVAGAPVGAVVRCFGAIFVTSRGCVSRLLVLEVELGDDAQW